MHSSNVPARRGSSRARNTSKVARLSPEEMCYLNSNDSRTEHRVNRKVDERQQSLLHEYNARNYARVYLNESFGFAILLLLDLEMRITGASNSIFLLNLNLEAK